MNRCSDRTNNGGIFGSPRRSGIDDIRYFRTREMGDERPYEYHYNRESVDDVLDNDEAGCRSDLDYFEYRYEAWTARGEVEEDW